MNGNVKAFWHVGYSVADLDRSIAFYCDGIGLELRSRTQASANAQLVWDAPGATAEVAFLGMKGGSDLIELYRFQNVEERSAAAPPWHFASAHLCLEVDDLAEVHGRLTAMGHVGRSATPIFLPTGVLAGGLAIYMIDPDGFHVELIQRPPAEQ